jgi:3-hydroxybutyryl-CoA dehydrogenase
MHIAVRATEDQRRQLEATGRLQGHQVSWYREEDTLETTDAELYFDLLFEQLSIHKTEQLVKHAPVIANSVITTCTVIGQPNYIRLNGWPGFRLDSLELAACDPQWQEKTAALLEAMEWQHHFVADEPGLITARTVSMIVNEAYFALEQEVSTKTEIDTAMKLGTNYPYGPFEWAAMIGKERIALLLEKLSQDDERYLPCPLLLQEAQLT